MLKRFILYRIQVVFEWKSSNNNNNIYFCVACVVQLLICKELQRRELCCRLVRRRGYSTLGPDCRSRYKSRSKSSGCNLCRWNANVWKFANKRLCARWDIRPKLWPAVLFRVCFLPSAIKPFLSPNFFNYFKYVLNFDPKKNCIYLYEKKILYFSNSIFVPYYKKKKLNRIRVSNNYLIN